MIRNILLVGLGGAAGAMLRYLVTLLFTSMQWCSNIGTLLTNITGSLVMGILVSACNQSPWLLMATVGICGGFTTFSTFSMQTVTLFQAGRYGVAVLYMTATAILCVAFCAIGWYIGCRLRG